MLTQNGEQLTDMPSFPDNPMMFSRSNELQLSSKTTIHHPSSGINPLVDSAAHLFSLATRYSQLDRCHSPEKLQSELITEINLFQDTIKLRGYNAEYLLVSRYALCATLDDLLFHTEWGAEWKPFSLLRVFGQEEPERQERFFLILERLLKEPNTYIELMELMYFCLSLGYKGSYRATGFTHTQLEMICDALYRHIRAQRGEFSKTLSPFSVKPPLKSTVSHSRKNFSPTSLLLTTASTILLLFVGLSFILDNTSHRIDHSLIQIGKTFTHDTIKV